MTQSVQTGTDISGTIKATYYKNGEKYRGEHNE